MRPPKGFDSLLIADGAVGGTCFRPQPLGNPFDTLLALDNNLNGGNPRNGFVSQRIIDKARFVYEDSHTTGEWNMLSNREHFLASKAAVRNASVSPPQVSHRVAVRGQRAQRTCPRAGSI